MTMDADAPSPYVRLPFPRETSLAELYHENTKFHPYMQEAEQDPTGATEDYGTTRSLQYAAPGDRLALPDPALVPDEGVSLEAAIRARRSRRGFTGEPVTLAQLSKLLHLTYGLTGAVEPSGEMGRAAPSAGARYPLELFPVVRHVEGVAPGVYHYHPESHSLERVEARDVGDELSRALFGQPFVPHAAVTVLFGAIFPRTLLKYRERGYRLVLLDAGHAAENLMLAATAMGLGSTGLGGFLDDALNDLVRLNGEDENVLYAVSVGRLPPEAAGTGL